VSFPELPPYEVPDADRDLLDCGLVLTVEHRVNVWAMNYKSDFIRRAIRRALAHRRAEQARRARIAQKRRGRP